MPLHHHQRKKRIKKLDKKVHTINETASAKPKLIISKTKLDKMKLIHEQTKAAQKKTHTHTQNLILAEFSFDPKQLLNKRLIFDTSIIEKDIIIDRIINAIANSYDNKYWMEHKPGAKCFTIRLENEIKELLKEARALFTNL